MRIAVTGSIATDHLMSFPGRFAEQIIPDQLEKISLSFLADELQVRRGGVAGNIAFGLGQLNVSSLLVGAVGQDFGDYRAWLEKHGVDTSPVRVSSEKHTARFVCTTDADNNQIASFYAGAMAEAREISLPALHEEVGGFDLVVISPNDPQAMLNHTQECREHGYPFLADPSQQMARMNGSDIRKLVEGATYLFTNEYERSLLLDQTGWKAADVLERVGTWVTSLGAEGVQLEQSDGARVELAPPAEKQKADPTGVGDALRAGFLAGLTRELGFERSLQLGCALATVSLETDGPQEYEVDAESFLARFGETYGQVAATEVAAVVRPSVLTAQNGE